MGSVQVPLDYPALSFVDCSAQESWVTRGFTAWYRNRMQSSMFWIQAPCHPVQEKIHLSCTESTAGISEPSNLLVSKGEEYSSTYLGTPYSTHTPYLYFGLRTSDNTYSYHRYLYGVLVGLSQSRALRTYGYVRDTSTAGGILQPAKAPLKARLAP
jgi:hypothetical protein